jgi:hypothetical protein
MQLIAGDRVKNMKYLFRQSEAAGIMMVLQPQQYAGHAEHAWNMLLKITLGICHVTADVRSRAPLQPADLSLPHVVAAPWLMQRRGDEACIGCIHVYHRRVRCDHA